MNDQPRTPARPVHPGGTVRQAGGQPPPSPPSPPSPPLDPGKELPPQPAPDEEKPKEGLPSEVTIWLAKPIKSVISPTTTSLTFREPTALDIDQVGNPVSMDFSRGWPPLPIVDSKKMTQMLARLGGVAPSSILQMNARDWATCSLAVQIFFLPDLARL